MTRSCYDKTYPVFKKGDIVYTDNNNFKAISSGIPYVVQRCYRPPGYIESYPVIMIELVSDRGFKSVYATDRFYKTKPQIRKDKLKMI